MSLEADSDGETMSVIAPSILAADFSKLGELIREVEAGGANRIHIDVMDGHFVPNLSMGPAVVKDLRRITNLPLEVHLMVKDPAKFVEPFRKSGADTLIFHLEVFKEAGPLIQQVRSLGAKVGLAINPGTLVEFLEPYLPDIDLALCMTVWPGFGGQPFLLESVERVAALRKNIDRVNPKCELEVDGGIDENTVQICAKAGANVFVAGTSIFGSSSGPREATIQMARLVSERL